MLLIVTQITIFCLFMLLMAHLIKKTKEIELFIVFLAVITVTIGEAMNLFVYKMAVYNGVDGIPLYIILGGAMVAWGIYKAVCKTSDRFNIECIMHQVSIGGGAETPEEDMSHHSKRSAKVERRGCPVLTPSWKRRLTYYVEYVFCRLFLLFLISLLLPVIEIIGLKTELWYWQRSYSILSLGWFLGVWKFYFIFIVSPAIIGLFLDIFRKKNNSCCCKTT